MATNAARVADFKTQHSQSKANTLTTITTYVHVIHSSTKKRISEKTIQNQISVLNEAYATYRFRFEMAPSVQGNPNPDYIDNAAWFGNQNEPGFKATLKERSDSDLNIYTNSDDGYLKYAYYPTMINTQYKVLNSIILTYETLPDADQHSISDIPKFIYNLNNTNTHEVSHYLNLTHTFENHYSPYNDDVADTPSEKSPNFYCTINHNSCKDERGTQLLNPINNFMDYSDNVYLFEFTLKQAERMNIQ